MAHRGSRGIALLFLDHGTRRGWGVSVTPWPLFTPRRDPVPIVQKAGWTPGPVWTCAENLTHTGIRSPGRPARSDSLYQPCYPAHRDDKARKEWVMNTYTFLVGWSCPCALWSTTSWKYMLGQCIPLYILTSLCKMKERCQLYVLACSALVPIEKQACGKRSLIHWSSCCANWALPTPIHLNICDYQRQRTMLCSVTGISCSCVSCNTPSRLTIICFMKQVGSA